MAIPEVLPINRQSPLVELVDRLAEHILAGGVAIVPTDTVYGLIGDATAAPAAEAIFRLKGRSPSQPLPVFVDGTESLLRWFIRLRPKYVNLARTFWPGPLTMVLPVWPGFFLRAGGDGRSVGVRVTAEPLIQLLMRKTNRYLFATSANPSGVDPHAVDYPAWLADFADGEVLWFKPEQYAPGAVSSVLDLTGHRPVLLREGAISGETFKKFLPDLGIRR